MVGSAKLGNDAVVSAMLDSVITVGLTGQVLSINPATSALLGYRADELVGQPISILFADDESALRTVRIERPTEGQSLRKEEVEVRAKNGELIPVSVIGAPLFEEEQLKGLVLVARDLRETRLLVSEVRAAKAGVESRLALAQQSLMRAERLATLGTLAAGVGHELGNISSVLSMSLEILRSGEPLDDELLAALGHVDLHVREHATRLLHLATPGKDEVETFDLAELVSETIEMCRRSGRCRYVEIAAQGAATVRASRVRIEQVLVNLIFNAADAVSEQAGRIDVIVERRGARAFCSVRDNGCGIEPERLDVVFEAFHTTKAECEGTGLGLAVVKQIVEEHQGHLTVESTLGEGTTFCFDLPKGGSR